MCDAYFNPVTLCAGCTVRKYPVLLTYACLTQYGVVMCIRYLLGRMDGHDSQGRCTPYCTPYCTVSTVNAGQEVVRVGLRVEDLGLGFRA